MNTEQKYNRVLKFLEIPQEYLFMLPDVISSLGPCLMSQDDTEDVILIPARPDVQMLHVFLRTKKLEDAEEFIREHGKEKVPDGWEYTIDHMLSKAYDFEVLEPSLYDDNSEKVDEDVLKVKLLIRI